MNSYLTDKTDIVMKKKSIFHSLFDSTLQQYEPLHVIGFSLSSFR